MSTPPDYTITEIQNNCDSPFWVAQNKPDGGVVWEKVPAGVSQKLTYPTIFGRGDQALWTISDNEGGTEPKHTSFWNNSCTTGIKFCRAANCDTTNKIEIGNAPEIGAGNLRVQINCTGNTEAPWIVGEVDMDPVPKYDIYSAELACGSEPAVIKAENGKQFDLVAPNFDLVNSRNMPIVSSPSDQNFGNSQPVRMEVTRQSDSGFSTVFHFFLVSGTVSGSNPPIPTLQLYYRTDDMAATDPAIAVGTPFDRENLKFGSMRVTFAEKSDGSGYTAESVSEPAVLSEKERIPARGYGICGSKHQVGGRLLDRIGLPLADCLVTLMDKDLFLKDDHLGTGKTNSEGYFEIEWDEKDHKDWIFDQKPDLCFKAQKDGKELALKGDRIFKNADPLEQLFLLQLI